ncbi:MAG: ATP cone domain-containing protein [candidate division KSB1 bacterium]|nr:ATP cone domain-containing protein [candidate division KSB1 bacterium]
MVSKVIKRDGSRENFIPEKIVVSCCKSGASPEAARRIASEIEKVKEQEIDSQRIREMVLEKLRKENPDWENNWLLYDRAVKRR